MPTAVLASEPLVRKRDAVRVIYTNRLHEFPASLVIAPKRLCRRFRHATPIEDITKTATWLRLNEQVQPGTPITFVYASGYYKVNSEKARRLERLAEISRNVHLLDVTPFCESIESLYITWRYIDRQILGYQHHYAFAGGHAERHGDRIVSSLDFDLNVSKIAPHCRIEKNPVRENRRVVRCEYTAGEHREYQSLRSRLFDTKKTPQPIVTSLADLVHAFESRRKASASHPGAVIVTNLDTYAQFYRQQGFQAGTYAKPPDVSQAKQVVFAEPPIVYTYRRLHIEMAAPEDCEIIDVRGDAKVDDYLGGRIDQETRDVGRFCRKLIEAQR